MNDTARDARTRAFLDVATWLAGPLGFSDDVLGAFVRWAREHGDLPGDYELVRVSRELVEQLVSDDSDPVVVLRIDRHDDGTCDLILRNAGEEAA